MVVLLDEAVEPSMSSDIAHPLVAFHHVGELVSIAKGDLQYTLKCRNSLTAARLLMMEDPISSISYIGIRSYMYAAYSTQQTALTLCYYVALILF